MGTVDKIIAYYSGCESMKETARKFGLSHQKIRKILITAGKFSSPQTNMIMSLNEMGLSAEEIAKKMNVTKKCVLSYLPYSKGMYYADNPTENALRIRKCKEKKKREQENSKK